MSDYYKTDHYHCWEEDTPPCGLPGKHRCCLCNEPLPQNDAIDTNSLDGSYSEVKAIQNDSIESIVEEYRRFCGSDGVNEEWLRRTLKVILTEQATQQAGELEKRVGMLRQWLNEDRITNPDRMVSNGQLMYWLTGDESHLPPQPKD